jgi:hypothetical protein
MKSTVPTANREATERAALRRRVQQFYRRFNQADWDACHALIDPRLTEHRKVKREAYTELMQAFKDAYGRVNPWSTRLHLHLDPSPKQSDPRPFAYVYIIWQDDAHGFHMFRERWVKDRGQWFTRVAGLVPNRSVAESNGD